MSVRIKSSQPITVCHALIIHSGRQNSLACVPAMMPSHAPVPIALALRSRSRRGRGATLEARRYAKGRAHLCTLAGRAPLVPVGALQYAWWFKPVRRLQDYARMPDERSVSAQARFFFFEESLCIWNRWRQPVHLEADVAWLTDVGNLRADTIAQTRAVFGRVPSICRRMVSTMEGSHTQKKPYLDYLLEVPEAKVAEVVIGASTRSGQ